MNALDAFSALTSHEPTRNQIDHAENKRYGGLHDAGTIASKPARSPTMRPR